MTGKPLQTLDAGVESHNRVGELTEEPRHADLAAFPERLFAADMAEIFRVSLKRFYALENSGAFLFAENRPRIGRKSWSRERVRQYFAGDLTGLTLTRSPRKRA